MNSSRIFQSFKTEAAFHSALGEAVHHFSFERIDAPDGKVYLRCPGHFVATEPSGKRSAILRRPLQNDGYEPSVTAALSFLLRTFDVKTFFDIGASSGHFSVLAASTEGREVSAYAFEMRPSEYEQIVKKVDAHSGLWSRLKPFLSGMSDHHEGERDIWFSRTRMFERKPTPEEYREPWWIRLKFLLRGVRQRDRLTQARVLMTSVDHFSNATGRIPDIIKVDVDGYEALVVPGAMKTLEIARPFLLLELHKNSFLKRFGKTRRDVVSPIFDLGYSAVLISQHNGLRSELVSVHANHAQFERQETNMFLFY